MVIQWWIYEYKATWKTTTTIFMIQKKIFDSKDSTLNESNLLKANQPVHTRNGSRGRGGRRPWQVLLRPTLPGWVRADLSAAASSPWTGTSAGCSASAYPGWKMYLCKKPFQQNYHWITGHNIYLSKEAWKRWPEKAPGLTKFIGFTTQHVSKAGPWL